MNAVNDEYRNTLRNRKSMGKGAFSGHTGAQENLPSAVIIIDTPLGVAAIAREQLEEALELASQLAVPNSAEPCHMPKERECLVTAEAASKVLGVPASWLLQRAREHRIPHLKIGKYVRFDVDRILVETAIDPG